MDGDGTVDAAGKETFTLEFIDPTTKRAGSFTFVLRQHEQLEGEEGEGAQEQGAISEVFQRHARMIAS